MSSNSNHTLPIPRSLYAAMLLQFSVGGAIMPFITIHLHDRGLSFSQASLIFMASSSTLLVFPFLWGMLSDRWIPLNRMFTLLNVLAVASLLLLYAGNSFITLLLGFTAFYACFNPTLMLINALSFHHLASPRDQFARLRAWGSIGWIVPSLPIFLWLIYADSQRMDFALLLAAGFALLMVAATFFLPHTKPGGEDPAHSAIPELPYWPAMRQLLGNKNYVAVLLAFFLMASSFSLFVYYSPPFLVELGLQRAWVGPIQCIGVVLEIILFRWLHRFIQRWGYSTSILIGCGALALRHALFVFSSNLWLLAASYLLAGMVIVYFHIGASILVNTIAGRSVRATAQTLLVIFGSGLGPMTANWTASYLTERYQQDLRPVFLLAMILALIAMAIIWLRRRQIDWESSSK